jgi:GR25 family glycosyltransferase involved in LPS biosynthesis
MLQNIQGFVIADTKKFPETSKRLNKMGFSSVNLFPAIIGKDVKENIKYKRNLLSYRAEHEIHSNKLREAHSSMPSWGGVGCYLSHVELWKKAAESKNGLLIFEEDANPVEYNVLDKLNIDFKEFLKQPDPHIFSIGYLGKYDSIPVEGSSTLSKAKEVVYGLQAYYISPLGAKILLKDAFPMEVQVDSYIGYKISKNELGFYTLSYNPISQANISGSKIQTKGVEMSECNSNNNIIILIVLLCISIIILTYFMFFKI